MSTRTTPPILIRLPDELRGARVVARAYRADDAEAVFEAVEESREHLRPWMDWVDEHRTLDDSRAFVARQAAEWLLRTDLTMGIWESATGHYLGSTGYHRIHWEVPSLEIGYWVRVTAEGHGFVTEATALLTECAFAQLGANRLEIRCDARNVRSAAVPERLGYHLEGRLRNEARAPDGGLRDTLIFGMTRADWDGRSGGHMTT
jgi:RimJ/RimL family protein N-acetyltransferase